jgi:ferredoxin
MDMNAAGNVTKEWIESIFRTFIERSHTNTLKMDPPEPAWDDFLVGFASGADPLFEFLKRDIGDFYWLPEEAYRIAFPADAPPNPEELTVISWILPQRRRTKLDNRAQGVYPSERWARNRLYGEESNAALRRHVAETLTAAGVNGAPPMLLPEWERRDSDKYGYASRWSERHTAFIAGLGTFGLCDGLITPKGKAIRAGSVVARIVMEPTPRIYPDNEHRAYCLLFSEGECGKCAERCPADALSVEGAHDKLKCSSWLREKVDPYCRERFGIQSYGCGLCQTAIPCESMIPVKKYRKAWQERFGG